MAVTEDASTPAVATTAGGSSASTLASASFSPPAGSVLVASCLINYATYPGSPPAVTVSDSASGTWTLSPAGQVSSAAAFAVIAQFTRPCVSAPGSITVTMQRGSDTSAAMLMLAVRVLDGANAGSPQGASAASAPGTAATTVEVTVTPTMTGSYLAVAGIHAYNDANTAASGTVTIASVTDTTDQGVLAAGSFSPVSSLTSTTVGWTHANTDQHAAAVLEVVPVTSFAGAGALSGSGTFGGTELTTAPGSGALSGTGAFGAAGAVTAVAAGTFTGSGAFGAAGDVLVPGQGAGMLTGSGAFGAAVTLTVAGAGTFTGSGTLGAAVTGTALQAGAFTGTGTLGLSGLRLGYALGLTGSGLMFVPQVLGGLVTGVGGAVMPQALPGSSQVAVAPPGSSNWQWIGTLGQVTALTYSFVCPGGCDKMTMTVMVPAAYRTQLFNPGWKVKITRGGHQVWDGKLDEPVPTSTGWNLTAVGTGNLGANFLATYTSTWPASQPDQIINNAISRGLPWSNPGLNSSPYASQFWFGQQVDSAAQTITAFLSLICTRGGLTWYVNSQPGGAYTGDDLTIFPLPTVPSRLLVCTTPVARTLGGDVNTIFIRYMSAADNSTTGTVATYGTVTAVNAASVAAHGTIETYIDLSDVGQMTSAAAAGVGNSALLAFQRASFAGPFSAGYGDLLNIGGQPIDPGTDQSGTVCRLILSDYAYGGEVTPEFPVSFLVGGYEWDDFGQVATISPFQSVDQSLTGLLSMTNTVLTPIAVASG